MTEGLSNEPGWLSGEVRGHVGWFPEAYVEKVDQATGTDAPAATVGAGDPVRHQLEGIQELPENVSDNGSIADPALPDASAFIPPGNKISTDEASSPVLGHVSQCSFFLSLLSTFHNKNGRDFIGSISGQCESAGPV